MEVTVVNGDLLDQKVDVIVNAWNRNIIPWWLLWPQGVSGAIKREGGIEPFKEIAKGGAMPLGSARISGSGKLPYKAIIHVAGIDLLWRSSEQSIRDSVKNAMAIVNKKAYESVAFPIIGAGSGSFDTESALTLMIDEFKSIESIATVVIVRYQP